MAIKELPASAAPPNNVDRFVSGAPDAQQPRKRESRKGGKVPITVTLDHRLVDKIDEAARIQGLSRSAYITISMNYAVNKGIFKE